MGVDVEEDEDEDEDEEDGADIDVANSTTTTMTTTNHSRRPHDDAREREGGNSTSGIHNKISKNGTLFKDCSPQILDTKSFAAQVDVQIPG